MYRRSFSMSSFDKNTFLPAAIVLCWIAGLSLGICADRFHGEAFRACFLLTPYQIPDYFGTMCINFLPLLISAYAVSYLLILLLCLLRAFLTGIGISAVAALYGSASGMMGGFILFSLLLYGPVLLWHWMRGQRAGRRFRCSTALCAGIAVIISCLDRFLVAPLIWEIMNF